MYKIKLKKIEINIIIYIIIYTNMVQEKCLNHIICSQFINKNINNSYCKDCLFYFNYTLIIKK
jgi:hypothetical protein